MQQAIQKVAFITLQTADSLLTVMSGKDPDKVDLNKLVSNAVDSIALLGHVTKDLNNFRHEQIRPALKLEFAALCCPNFDYFLQIRLHYSANQITIYPIKRVNHVRIYFKLCHNDCPPY